MFPAFRTLVIPALAAALSLPAAAQDASLRPQRSEHTLSFNTISVIGRNGNGKRLTGSAQSLDRAAIERQDYSDVHRLLREIPGVEVREEDGFGLRPNIGIRGTAIDRSGKVAVMEDGILV